MKHSNKLESLRPIFFFSGLIIALGLVIGSLQYRVPLSSVGPIAPDTLAVFVSEEPLYTYKVEPKKPEPRINKELPPVVDPDPFPDPDPSPKPDPIPHPIGAPVDSLASVDMPVDPGMPETLDVHMVQHKPIFPGCEALTSEQERNKCLEEQLGKFIAKNTNYPEFLRNVGVSGRSYIQFTVNSRGEIVDVQAVDGRNDPLLDKEAVKAIKKLPVFTPGKHNGLPVNVHFTVPVNFQLR
jgi:protein TonB